MTKESLLGKQIEFGQKVYLLMQFMLQHGFRYTFGEAYRPPEMAEIYAKRGTGITNSLHGLRLAIDFNIFDENEQLINDNKQLEKIGLYWETLGGSWGGRFKKVDSGHFSLEHNGVR